MSCSIVDVAKKAGVSHTTVSRILRGAQGYSFSPETCKKVRGIAFEMGYTPNLAAKFMRTKETKMLGITTQSQNAYATYMMIEKCSVKIKEYGYNPVIIDLSEYSSNTGNFLGSMNHLAGLICVYSRHEEEAVTISEKLGLNIPIITLRKKITDNSNVRMVTSDTPKGLEKAFKHLYKLKHRNIAYLGYDNVSGRPKSYQDLCKKYNVKGKFFKVEMKEENNSFMSGVKVASEIVSSGKFSAVLCEDDEFGIGLIAGLNDNGKKVPDDISVIGFDDLPFAQAVRPAITTVGVNRNERIDGAVKLLISLIEGNEMQKDLLPKEIVLDCNLIIRDSTGPAKNGR